MKASFQRIFIFILKRHSSLFAQIAQSVEQRTENPRVAGSIPALGTDKSELIFGLILFSGIICYSR